MIEHDKPPQLSTEESRPEVDQPKGSRASLCLALFLLAWILPGLVGRDPWKADEAYSFGMTLEMIQTGHWTIPTLAGEPFMEKPPIMYVVSAISAKLLAPLLPLPDAARGSVLFFNGLTFLCLGYSARLMYGRGQGWLAPVILIGTVGLIHNQHMLITDVALITGFAMGHLGLVLTRRCSWAGGAIAGTGLGLAFLSKGLLGPGLMGITALALLAFRPWRTPNYLKALLVMGMAFLPWAILWPWLVWRQSPTLFHEWFWVNNVGRFMGQNGLGPKTETLFYFRLLPWFAFPAIWLALGTWWRERAQWRTSMAWQLGLVSFGVMLVVLSASRQARSLYAQPMLVPLSLAAVPSVLALNGRLVRAFSRLNATLFFLVAIGGWTAWNAMLWVPAARNQIQARVPGYEPQFLWFPALIAALATAALAWRWRHSDPRDGRDAAINWAAALGYAYLLGMTLFLPLANVNMGYRSVFIPLREYLPPNCGTIASLNLGEPQRGLLHYLAGLRTRRIEVDDSAWDKYDLLLVQGDYTSGYMMQPPSRGAWDLRFEGRRGGRESFRLYQRRQPAHSTAINKP
jgi:4-amino-4-deoxy-L-arabinose transferase-like glycosyltransferase